MNIRLAKKLVSIGALAVLSVGCATSSYRALESGEFPSLEPARAVAPVQTAPASTTDLFITLGSRSLDDTTAWEGIENPFSLGFEGAHRAAGSQLGFEYGLLLASDSVTINGVEVRDTFVDFYGGARFTWDLGAEGRFHPYAGGGLTYILAEVSGEAGGYTVSDSDGTLGFYVHAGAYYRIGESFNLGLDGRAVRGTSVEIFGIETDVDYTQLSLLFGWSI